MSTKDDADGKEKMVSPLGFENLADILASFAGRYRQAARLMRESGLEELAITGLPTALRGIRYLDRHTKAVSSLVLADEKMLKEVAPELADDLTTILGDAIGDVVAKHVTKRKGGRQ